MAPQVWAALIALFGTLLVLVVNEGLLRRKKSEKLLEHRWEAYRELWQLTIQTTKTTAHEDLAEITRLLHGWYERNGLVLSPHATSQWITTWNLLASARLDPHVPFWELKIDVEHEMSVMRSALKGDLEIRRFSQVIDKRRERGHGFTYVFDARGAIDPARTLEFQAVHRAALADAAAPPSPVDGTIASEAA